MYRIAICDDEKIFNESAQVLLENIALKNGIDISVESYLNADILLNDLENGNKYFDLVLFDIIIGNKNGINIACKIKQNFTDIKFIFMTSYSEYAIDGYEADSLLSLWMKPSWKELFWGHFKIINHKAL